MKHKKYFWGIFFIALGAFTLLIKYDVIETNLTSLIDFWPLLFVFWGLAIISKDTVARPIISILSAIFMVLLVISIFQNIFEDNNFKIEISDDYNNTYLYDYNDSIEFANLEFNSGAGKFRIGGYTKDLIDAKSRTSDFDYNFDVYRFDSLANVDFSLEGEEKVHSNFENRVRMKLNENPIWDLEFKIGASKADLDLSDYKIRKLELKTGAADLAVKLGSRQSLTYVNADIGAVKLKLEVPKESGCRINFNQFLVVKDLEGFHKVSDGTYETTNYDESENKIVMKIDGGVSTFKVKRY